MGWALAGWFVMVVGAAQGPAGPSDPNIAQDAAILGGIVFAIIEATDVNWKKMGSRVKKVGAPAASGLLAAATHGLKVLDGSQQFSTNTIMLLGMATYAAATGLHAASENTTADAVREEAPPPAGGAASAATSDATSGISDASDDTLRLIKGGQDGSNDGTLP